jgi:hypothetical protein
VNRIYTLLLCIIVWLAAKELKAQSTERKFPTRFTNEYNLDRNLGYTALDTNMNETEIFQAWYQKSRIFQDLGNIGTPGRSLVFSLDREVGFRGAFNPYDAYFMNRNQVRYFNTTAPFTELFYAQGSKELLFLKATHAQNILPRWSAALDYQRITSEGFMLRQKTSMYNIQLNTRYFSKDKRYELLAYAIWNKGYTQENGGISNDSAYEALTGANKTVNVWLNNSQNDYSQRSLQVKQYYKFGSPVTLIQQEDTLYDYQSKAQLSHTIRTEEYSSIFSNTGDTLNALFPNQYISNTANNTYDSVYHGLIENKLNLQLFANSENQFKRFINLGASHQAIVVGQPLFVKNYQNVLVDAQLEWVKLQPKTLSYWFDGGYCVSGFNAGDYKLNALIRYKTNLLNYFVGGSIQRFHPEYTYYRMGTNQFIWDNNLTPTVAQSARVVINTNKLRNNFYIVINQHTITNYTYLNSGMTPEQKSGAVHVFHVELSKTFQLGKFFFKHHIHIQQSNDKVIPLPLVGGMARYYFQTKFYGSTLQIGFDAFYNSSYYGMEWNPASRMFFLQQRVKIGNYPLIDPFLSMQIKRGVLFAKFEHVNQNLINTGFYNTPHYPISLQSFRMGVRWRMYY